jgi:hypothetical protein
MKKILVLLFTGSLLFNISCTSWLKEEQFDKINSSILYQSEAGLNTALNGLYSLNRRYYRFIDTPDTRSNYWFYCADDLGCTRTYNEGNIYREAMIPTSFYSDLWVNGYQLIDRASAVIVNARNVEMSTASRNKIQAVAKAIRAMTYLRLVTVYSNILLDTIPTTPANAFDKVEYLPASKTSVYSLINADLDFAIANLPYAVAAGQIGQGLARHLRAESAMWTGDYATAVTQVDAIAASNTYNLVAIDQIFGENPNLSETILTLPFDELLGGSDQLSGGSGSPLGAAFQARFYEIPMAGLPNPIIEDNVYGGNAFGWTVPNKYLRSLYDEKVDKRMKFYYYPDTLIVNNPANPYFGKPIPLKLPYSNTYRQYHWSIMKYRDFKKSAGTAMSYKSKIMYRFAETLLLGAEAHWRVGGNTDAKALEYINKVRTRAGIPNLTTIDLTAIMDEHARELAFEGHRWFFLKRIGKLYDQFNAYHTLGSSTTNEKLMVMKAYQADWPIPQGQIDIMVTFPQNTGY